MFAHRPVYALAAFDHLAAAIQQPADCLVNVKICRDDRDAPADVPQLLDRNAGIAAPIVAIDARDAGPAAVEPSRFVRFIPVRYPELALEIGAIRFLHL